MDHIDLIDTHCHLNDPSFAPTLPGVIARARAEGVNRFVVPAYDAPSLGRTAELADGYPGLVFPAFGFHPWFLHGYDPEKLRPLLGREDTVAVGEIGLDFASPDYPPPDEQLRALDRQLGLAVEFGLPVLLHCRRAYDPLFALLKEYRGRLRGVLHSYSGGADLLPRFLDLGLDISFSGSVTRSNARKYHRTAAAVPADRFLLETDAPSIATESTAGSEVEPRHVVEVAQKIAALRGRTLEEIAAQSTQNALALFTRIPRR